MPKHRIAAVEGIKHEDEPGFPKSRVVCKCGWKSKPYSSDSVGHSTAVLVALAQYVDHRFDELDRGK